MSRGHAPAIEYCTTVDDVASSHGAFLRSLVGRSLREGWVAWDTTDDEWFADERVVLRFGRSIATFLFSHLSRLSISTSSSSEVQLPKLPYSGFDLEWRRNGHSAIEGAVGQTIRVVELVEYLMTTRPEGGNEKLENWILSGVAFTLQNGSYLTFFNALDCNGLGSVREEGPDFRYTVV